MWTEKQRSSRHIIDIDDVRDDGKSPFQRDVDRILYSSAFRRLSGITQIVRSGEEEIFHNRLTHSLKVAQVGRRICASLISKQPKLAKQYHLNCDVVEAACLAHDLGHPPFGHHGEKILNRLVLGEIQTIENDFTKQEMFKIRPDPDGFEGNAQTIRIITKLSALFMRKDAPDQGLDLTQAVVAGCIKYPWAREPNHKFRSKKWGYYSTEQKSYDWARKHWEGHDKTIDCQIMDIADDITYSVHDLEDFHRCGVIPWKELFMDPLDSKNITLRGKILIQRALERWTNRLDDEIPRDAEQQLRNSYHSLAETICTWAAVHDEPYDGRREHRVQTRQLVSNLVSMLTNRLKLVKDKSGKHKVSIGIEEQNHLRLLKGITIDYILSNPALMAQQLGQGRVLIQLFGDFLRAMVDPEARLYLPRRFGAISADFDRGAITARRAASDCICSLTEGEAMAFHARLRGFNGGSVMHPLVR